MNIILCGFMGCGKSTIGKALADKINFNFVDSDELIEKSKNMSVSQIFEKYGELTFRKIETETISKISKFDSYVISLGGGSILNAENVKIIKNNSKMFFLNISANEVYNRLKNDTSRPLLQTDNKLETISKILSKRLPIYKQVSDYTIEVDGKSIDEIVEEIIKNI